MRILVAVEPADFRKGIDGLAQLCRAALKQDPFGGAIFVFRNRRVEEKRKNLKKTGFGPCVPLVLLLRCAPWT